jgi:hypothetical protein
MVKRKAKRMYVLVIKGPVGEEGAFVGDKNKPYLCATIQEAMAKEPRADWRGVWRKARGREELWGAVADWEDDKFIAIIPVDPSDPDISIIEWIGNMYYSGKPPSATKH